MDRQVQVFPGGRHTHPHQALCCLMPFPGYSVRIISPALEVEFAYVILVKDQRFAHQDLPAA